MLACDFLTVETVWLTRIYVLFFVSLERRRIEFVTSTANPNSGWVVQQARNLLMLLDDRKQSFRFLIHDRDSKFGGGFDQIFRSEGMTIVRTPVRAPNANAYAERVARRHAPARMPRPGRLEAGGCLGVEVRRAVAAVFVRLVEGRCADRGASS